MMREDQIHGCIDAGREGCPCALAEGGKCLICARHAGGTCADCSWQGVCVHTLYEQNGRQPVPGRRERELEIIGIKTYSETCKVFILKADRGFCQKGQTLGAYVFVRPKGTPPWYDMPVSVLKAEPEKELLHLGVCGCGPKSLRLLKAADKLSVRGVYGNALSGLTSLRQEPSRTIVFAKGIAIAPLRNLLDGGLRYEKWRKGLRLYVDLDKVGEAFFQDYFGDLRPEAAERRSFAKDGLCPLEELDRIEADADCNVFALTSPYYADQIRRAACRPVVRPVQGNLCCGEGVCGACTYDDAGGKTVHRCKSQALFL